jgi:hypothetical protein
MLYTGMESREAVLTEQIVGCCLEFKVPGLEKLYYAVADRFEARRL